MLKKIGMLSVFCLPLFGCYYSNAQNYETQENAVADTGMAVGAYDASMYQQQYQPQPQPQVKMPASIVVCRSKQCAPAKLSMSKEYIYNTLLHMFDSNARQKALVCAADVNTHSCTEEYITVPMTVGVTPADMYINDVKITDVSISDQNTAAMNLTLNWGISYNGQTPTCRPSKTLLYAKNINNVVMEDDGYNCKMTTVGTTNIKTMFAIDYIDLDFGFIGGFYSIGLSGPAYGGGSGYMLLRLPEEISMNPKDFAVSNSDASENKKDAGSVVAETKSASDGAAPNVDTVIRYNHPSQQYDRAQEYKKQEKESGRYKGVQVFPVNPAKTSKDVNEDK